MGDEEMQAPGATGTGTGLEPGTALTVSEAATLAGVEVGVIQGAIDDGALLSERQRRGARERVVVRLFDLADLYPHVLGRPDPEEAPRAPRGPDEADAGAPPRGTSGAAVAVPDPESPGQDAPRAALIELCQDLETRLDLAERERQASTASLLMAQRRVLDLEARLRSGPWVRAAGVGAFALACAALAVTLTLPGRVHGALERRTQGLEETLEARLAEVARGAEANARNLASAAATREEELHKLRVEEAARGLEERRTLEVALADVESRLAAAGQRAAEREADLAERLRESESQAAEGRERFTKVIDGYARELAETRAAAAQESAGRREDALARARAEAEADAAAAAAMEATLAELRAAAADGRAQVETLLEERRALEAAFTKAKEEEEPAPATAEPGSNSSWWRRLFGDR